MTSLIIEVDYISTYILLRREGSIEEISDWGNSCWGNQWLGKLLQDKLPWGSWCWEDVLGIMYQRPIL